MFENGKDVEYSKLSATLGSYTGTAELLTFIIATQPTLFAFLFSLNQLEKTMKFRKSKYYCIPGRLQVFWRASASTNFLLFMSSLSLPCFFSVPFRTCNHIFLSSVSDFELHFGQDLVVIFLFLVQEIIVQVLVNISLFCSILTVFPVLFQGVRARRLIKIHHKRVILQSFFT